MSMYEIILPTYKHIRYLHCDLLALSYGNFPTKLSAGVFAHLLTPEGIGLKECDEEGYL